MNRLTSLLAAALIVISTTALADEPLKNPYQQRSDTTTCYPTNSACQVAFPASTYANLLIKHVSCAIQILDGTPPPTNAALLDGSYENVLPLFATGTDGFGLNVETYLFVNLGETPTIIVVGNVSPDIQCTISGYHSDH